VLDHPQGPGAAAGVALVGEGPRTSAPASFGDLVHAENRSDNDTGSEREEVASDRDEGPAFHIVIPVGGKKARKTEFK
jgi:hypothetical protein